MIKTLKYTTVSLTALALASFPAHADTLQVALSPYGDPEAKKIEVVDFIMLATKVVEPGERAEFLNGMTGGTICTFKVPDRAAYSSQKAKLNANKGCAGKLVSFAKQADTSRPAGTLDLPRLLRTIVTTSNVEEIDAIILSGSPIHDDPREPSTSMALGDVPSDGYNAVSQGASPYGMAGLEGRLKGTPMYMTAEGVDWVRNSNHAHLVNRFWATTTDFLGGPLVSFNQDLEKVAEQVQRGVTTPALTFERSLSNKLEMIAAEIDQGRGVPIHERQLSTKYVTATELRYARNVEIGITWSCECDIDIYVQPGSGDQPLFYGNRTTAEGTFHRDFRSGKDLLNGLEYVTLQVPVDLEDMLIGVNFYGGKAENGVEGEIRVAIGPRTYAMPLKISGDLGNAGKGRNKAVSSRKAPNDRWFLTTADRVVSMP